MLPIAHLGKCNLIAQVPVSSAAAAAVTQHINPSDSTSASKMNYWCILQLLQPLFDALVVVNLTYWRRQILCFT